MDYKVRNNEFSFIGAWNQSKNGNLTKLNCVRACVFIFFCQILSSQQLKYAPIFKNHEKYGKK